MADKDWYAELGVEPDASEERLAEAIEKLSRMASALANTSPERSQRTRDLVRAMKRDLLSGASARQAYDARRDDLRREATVESTDSGRSPTPDSAAPMWEQQQPNSAPSPSAASPAAASPASGSASPGSPADVPFPTYYDQWGRPIPAGAYYDAWGRPVPQPTMPDPYAAGPRQGERTSERLKKFIRSAYICQKCRTPTEPTYRFCVGCGERQKPGQYRVMPVPAVSEDACPYCYTVAAADHRYCRNCGAGRGVA